MLKNFISIILLLLVSLFLFSCSSLKNYGRIRPLKSEGIKIDTKYLIEHWEEYRVYYAGVSEANANAVLFDPKKDEKSLTLHEWWLPVIDRTQLDQITGFMLLDTTEPDTYGIIGPDNNLYGFLFTTVNHVTIKVIDDATLWIDDLSTRYDNIEQILPFQ